MNDAEESKDDKNMEDKFLEKLNKAAKDTHLTIQKKASIKDALVRFADASIAVRERAAQRHIAQRPNQSFIFKPMYISAFIAIMALVGGGTSAAAERALPGDALYGVKVNVNEEVRAAIAFSAESKADWEARRAERRLEEAEALAERGEGEINAEVKADIEARFAAHADRVEERIKRLETDGKVRVAADVASRFEASLDAHANVLARLESKNKRVAALRSEMKAATTTASAQVTAAADVRADVKPIEVSVRKAANKLIGVRAGLEAKVEAEANGPEVKAAAEGKIGAAENVISSAESFIARQKEALGAEATVEAEAKLKEADALSAEATAKVGAQAYGEAFNLGNRAIRTAQEARARVVQWKIDSRVSGSASSATATSVAQPAATGATSATNAEVKAGVGAATAVTSSGTGAGVNSTTNVDTEGEIRLRLAP